MQERVKLTVLLYIFFRKYTNIVKVVILQTIDTTDDIAFDAIDLNNNNQCIIVCFLVVFFSLIEKKIPIGVVRDVCPSVCLSVCVNNFFFI